MPCSRVFRANTKCNEIDDNTHCPSPSSPSKESRITTVTKPKIKIPVQGKMQGAKEKICPFFKVCQFVMAPFLPRVELDIFLFSITSACLAMTAVSATNGRRSMGATTPTPTPAMKRLAQPSWQTSTKGTQFASA